MSVPQTQLALTQVESVFNSMNAGYPSAEVIAVLLEEMGVSANFKLANGHSLLWKALQSRNLEVSELLIARGANIHEEIDDEPLIFKLCGKTEVSANQFQTDNKKLIQLLISAGAHLFGPLKKGDTLESFAKAVRNKTIIQAIREDKQERKEVDEENQQIIFYKLMKKMGHVIGSKKQVGIVAAEGDFAFRSYAFLQAYLESMSREMFSIEFKQHYQSSIRESFELARNWLEMSPHTNHQSILEHYNLGKPTILPVVWSDAKDGLVNWHAISIIAWNDILIVTNRGHKKFTDAISVFKITNPAQRMTDGFLKSVMPENGVPLSSDVLDSINALVGHQPPFLVMSAKDQKYGNCTFANIKTAMKILLLFLNLLKAESKAIQHLNSAFLESILKGCVEDCKIKAESRVGAIMRNVLQEFKTFTHYIRFKFTQELYRDFEKLPKSSPLLKNYLEMFESMLEEHYYAHRQDKPVKNQVEIVRARMIMDTIRLALPVSRDMWPPQCQVVDMELRNLDRSTFEFLQHFDANIDFYCEDFKKSPHILQETINALEYHLAQYCAQYYVGEHSAEREAAEIARAKKMIHTLKDALPPCQMEWPPQLRRQAIILEELEKVEQQHRQAEQAARIAAVRVEAECAEIERQAADQAREAAEAARRVLMIQPYEAEIARLRQLNAQLELDCERARQAHQVEHKLQAEQAQIASVQPQVVLPPVAPVILGRNGRRPPPPPPVRREPQVAANEAAILSKVEKR